MWDQDDYYSYYERLCDRFGEDPEGFTDFHAHFDSLRIKERERLAKDEWEI